MPARPEITGRGPGATADVAERKAGPPSDDSNEIEPFAHFDPDVEPVRKRPPVRGPPLAFSVQEFCALHGISRSYFYLLVQRGLAPRTMRLGSRVLISVEEATRWRAERTEFTASDVSDTS
jgi:predicted DNA-binding transcriptional regulator AlpA